MSSSNETILKEGSRSGFDQGKGRDKNEEEDSDEDDAEEQRRARKVIRTTSTKR